MAILEKEVLVTVGASNISHYKRLGYAIIRKGVQISVKIEHLPPGSGASVTKICDGCGKNLGKKVYRDVMYSRNKTGGDDRCKNCTSFFLSYATYESSAEKYLLQNNLQYLMEEYSDKNEMDLKHIFPKSQRSFIWKCKHCGSEYKARMASRIGGMTGCPFCSSQNTNHTNSIKATDEALYNLLYNKIDGGLYTKYSKRKIDFCCMTCGLIIKNKMIASVARQGLSCPICSDGISYPEKFISSLLKQINLEFRTQQVFEWSQGRRYDFYIPSLNSIIEAHGEQHYTQKTKRSSSRSRTLQEEIENDKFKQKMALDNKISNYIVINCSKSNMEFIKTNILNHNILAKLIDLEIVSWIKCHIDACKSLISTVCDLWNNGVKDIDILSKKTNLHRTTIYRYLKIGHKAGLCEHKSRETERCVVQIHLDSSVLEEHKSIQTAALLTGVHAQSICNACRGKQKTAGGYKWMYKEDYDKYIAKASNE
ncbi:zinc-ribbon domain-containing protein [Paenibacillus spiritus]|uniref:zinc-ribbon domain-containing protein n=1 Tax=Paenibacillus spiritus TaxID=2496557 RepID=UPI00168C017A|nr:zinc-ribbon domain-containing protein [Paenibacillus spiritus]